MLSLIQVYTRYFTNDVQPKAVPITEKEANAKRDVSLNSVLADFVLSNEVLGRVIEAMNKQMNKGLAGLPSSISMLPSFVPCVPNGKESGNFLAMDLGGTNLRCLLLSAGDGEANTTSRMFKVPISVMTGSGEKLFQYMVDCLATFLKDEDLAEAGLPLGFTFSFPCLQHSLRSATLLRWTKGFSASDVEGNDVVRCFEDALRQRLDINVRVVALLNDTVGTQLAAAYDHGACDIAAIVATGTNASYVEKSSKITKLQQGEYAYDQMIINTEWGGFGDRGEIEFVKTKYDRVVDSNSTHPGVYIFDKLIAGMYMGELVRLVIEELIVNDLIFRTSKSACHVIFQQGRFPTKYITEILFDESGQYSSTKLILDELGVEGYEFADILILKEVCLAVSRRSANLTAAALACLLKRLALRKPYIGIDGSTYRFHPFYDSWVKDKVRELIGGEVRFKIQLATDGSGKGAALGACIAERLKNS